jgi:hypothetical protein
MRYRHKRPEDQIQRVVLEHLRIRGPRNAFWFHPANGGGRSPVEGAILKGLAVRPGVPDPIIVHTGKVFALELKANGQRSTPIQTEAQEALRAAGAEVAVAVGLDAALEQLESWQLLKGWTA